MRKKVFTAVLLFAFLVSIVSQGVLAADIKVPDKTVAVSVEISVETVKGAFAGTQFSISYSDGLIFDSFILSDVFKKTDRPFHVEKDGMLHFGVIAGANSYKPADGATVIGELSFKYEGKEPQNLVISNLILVRLIDSDTTEKETFGPLEFNISREKGDDKKDDDKKDDDKKDDDKKDDDKKDDDKKDDDKKDDDKKDDGGVDVGAGGGGATGATAAPEVPTQIGETSGPGGGADVRKIIYAPFINGYPNGTVNPDGLLTRAELAQIIYNLYAEDAQFKPEYSDVTDDHWAYNAIGFCQESGYMIGYPQGDFMPEATVTRAELATALVRIKNLELTPEHPFTDIGDHWAEQYVGASFKNGIILGYPDGTFRPDNPVTRAEAVTMICRAEQRDESLFDEAKTFTDLDEGFWGYKYIMSAANGYNYGG